MDIEAIDKMFTLMKKNAEVEIYKTCGKWKERNLIIIIYMF